MRWADLADIVNRMTRNQFPATATIYHAGSATGDQITAVFDEAAQTIELDSNGNPIDSTQPQIDIRKADLAYTPKIRDLITIEPQTRTGETVTARTYEIVSVRPSSAGNVVCILMETTS